MADDKHLTYESPRALRLGDKPSAAGVCSQPGSGDTEYCEFTGNTAAGYYGCTPQGNAASGHCYKPGNIPTEECVRAGNGDTYVTPWMPTRH